MDARRFLPTSAPTPLGGQNRRNRIAIGCWNTAQTRCELSVAFALEISTPGGRRLAWTQANAVPQCVTIGSAHPDLLAGGGGQRTHRALKISYNHTSIPLPDAGTMRAHGCVPPAAISSVAGATRRVAAPEQQAASTASRTAKQCRRPASRVILSWRVHRATELGPLRPELGGPTAPLEPQSSPAGRRRRPTSPILANKR